MDEAMVDIMSPPW